ncbi:unnamed protein product [Rotaria sordida]|uniref:Uncharacterized protein n=1 Tax=Rotaria sordida TaxID=392033 RepID=A0A815X6Z6_9BILA|nr:unnamed protein product [Rotaria sordida]CAF1553599.1 unnamed protein product [Rotaria sordida]
MLVVECIFYPDEFILRNKIDYKTIYLSKYYNPLRLKQVIFYENKQSFTYIIDSYNQECSNYVQDTTMDQFLCNAVRTTTIEEDRLLKDLFHGLRYLDIGEQLIRTKSIYDFKRVSHILFEIKEIFINNEKNFDFVIDYIQSKNDEYKTIINELVPTNTINGTFRVHVTLDKNNIEQFLNICQENALEPNLDNDQVLIASFDYVGIYPNILAEIKTFVDLQFKDFNIKMLKIETSSSNNGVPKSDIDKILFWNPKSNYFEFHYKIPHRSKMEFERLKQFCFFHDLHLARKVLTETPHHKKYYTVTMRLFNVGRINAFSENNRTAQNLRYYYDVLLENESTFVVYDSNIELENQSNLVTLTSSKTQSTAIMTGPRYLISFKNRKAFGRSTDW